MALLRQCQGLFHLLWDWRDRLTVETHWGVTATVSGGSITGAYIRWQEWGQGLFIHHVLVLFHHSDVTALNSSHYFRDQHFSSAHPYDSAAAVSFFTEQWLYWCFCKFSLLLWHYVAHEIIKNGTLMNNWSQRHICFHLFASYIYYCVLYTEINTILIMTLDACR